MAKLTALFVPDRRTSHEAIVDIASWEATYGTPVIPIVNESALSRRVRRLWTSMGIDWQGMSIPNAPNGPVAASDIPPLPDLPDFIAADDGIEPSLRSLAGALAKQPILNLDSLTCGMPCGDPSTKSLMLLISLERMSPHIFALINRISSTGMTFGLVPVLKGAAGQYSVIKALTTGGTIRPRRFKIVSDRANETLSDAAPTSIERVGGASIDIIRDTFDVLLVSGHSNPWHLVAGPELVVCSRNRKYPSSHKGGLPCFYGAGCPVQASYNRDVFSSSGLASISECRAHVLVLWGCDNVRLDATAVDQLVCQAWRSDAIAVVASSNFVPSRVGMHALLLGLLSDGATLGRAVRELNALLGTSSDVRSSVGPMLLFGNPNLMLRGHIVSRGTVRDVGNGITVKIPRDHLAAPEGSFVRFDSQRKTRLPSYLCDKTASMWCHGAYTADGIGYLWARLADSNETSSPHITLEPVSTPPTEDCETFQCLADALLLWQTKLDSCVRQGRDTSNLERYKSCQSEIPKTLERCRRLAKRWPDREEYVMFDKRRDGMTMERVDKIDQETISLCEGFALLLLDQVRIWRVSNFILGLRSLHCEPDLRSDVICTCGQGRMLARVYDLEPIVGHPRQRIEYRCEACGAIDVNDGRAVLRLISADTRVTQNSAVVCKLHARAPQEESLYISYGAIITPWLPTDSQPATVIKSLKISRGSTCHFEVRIDVPRDHLRGRQELAVCATVNGMVWCACRSVTVE